MLLYQIEDDQLTALGYCATNGKIYDLSYLKESKTVWNTLASLILAGNTSDANELITRALSMAMCDHWARMRSGLWYLQYAGHVFCVRSDGPVQVSLEYENKNSRVPTDLAILAAEIAYHIRRRWYEDRVARRTAERNTRRDYRSYQAHRTHRTYRSYNSYRYRIR